VVVWLQHQLIIKNFDKYINIYLFFNSPPRRDPLWGPRYGDNFSEEYGVKLTTQFHLVLRTTWRGDVQYLHSPPIFMTLCVTKDSGNNTAKQYQCS